MSMIDCTVRLANTSDFSAIASLHAASWRTAYKGILPDQFLGDGLETEREAYWIKKMSALKEKEFVLIAESKGEAVGFIAVLDKPENGIDAFIDNLHARPDMKGMGIGERLMREAAKKLAAGNRKSVYLWVLVGNTAAEGFYLSKGARIADTTTVVFGGSEVLQRRFVWDTLDPLL
ncbi:GNAT family N-acetyltransferase [Fulvivirgaceae bacterium PWU4]|uniref:GNAT family N-acetyltransferase n=1 Tax=Chryseosolibacter histidini TaxID=2782349 RepID=A0AAP2DKJ0_9BACT|nr:GNAT family N-acetyltransferase [Chryseosolibacter histidini]MBT1698045.1 GNAT family N-acetyltransferase [Chryseosolibacter histidini]